jgi:dTDP-4-amino-4,6-dideoxygalactose transaminase
LSRLPVGDEAAESVLSLPMGPYLSVDDQRTIAEAVSRCMHPA